MLFIIGIVLVLGVIIFDFYLSSDSSLDFRLNLFYSHPQEEVITIMWIVLGIGVFLIIVGIIKHFALKKKLKKESSKNIQNETNKLEISKSKKVIIPIIVIIVIVALFLIFVFFVNSKRTVDSSELRDMRNIPLQNETTIDWSEYVSHGNFTDEGIAWACTEDYTGHKCGYINTDGDVIIPFKDNLIDIDGSSLRESYDDYTNGVVLVAEGNNGEINVKAYDTQGNVITSISENHFVFFSVTHFTGVNNVMFEISDLGAGSEVLYIYYYDNQEIKKFDGGGEFADNFSDGLLYSRNAESVIFYDENFNEALKITMFDNENYGMLPEVSDFKNGKATLLFIGKDHNQYTVTIDKTGKWLDEPQKYEDEYDDFRDDMS